MKLLIIDGNSILNRAFYGIKLLTTKDGRFTNAIYGFMNIFLRLREECSPDAVAVAFDVKAPTFRHKLFSEYKAGRHAMPTELFQQLPVTKELLEKLGVAVLEQPGWEADDILGTLADACTDEDECFIATGDRDSLQLVRDNVTVLLASTKMGRPQTVNYTPQRVVEEYGVAPPALIEIKALMGDSSDNIPGVAGVGQKTAGDLIARFGSIDKIYDELDSLDIKAGVREKLRADRDRAFLSRELGTIRTDAPIVRDIAAYVPSKPDAFAAARLLAELEMFSTIKRLDLGTAPAPEPQKESEEEKSVATELCAKPDELLTALKQDGEAYFTAEFEDGYFASFLLARNGGLTRLDCGSPAFAGFIEALLKDEKIKKHTVASKPVFAYAVRNGFRARGIVTDVELAGYILNPSASDYSVPMLAAQYGVALPNAESESLSAAAALPRLCEVLGEKISENGQGELLRSMEIPLAEVLASMELAGFTVDEAGISAFGETLGEKLEKAREEIFAEVGYEFNLNSPKQLGEALFVKMGLPSGKKTKNGYSTNADVLEGLSYEYPVVGKILEYRTLSKLKSTYCDGLLKVIAPDGRIHSTLNQTETRTGRISSTEPNLQNIPVRSQLGREMRKFFRAADGLLLVDADYSQIELRVLAHISSDAEMLSAFNGEETDIHTVTASQVFGMPVQMVTPLMRSRAKAVNFGIVYGIGAFSLAKDIGVSRAEADRYIKGYLNHYSGVARYMERVVVEAKKNGYVETLFARRRYLPELAASNANLRNFGERVARNMPIQGTAADIIKLAMIKVFNRLADEGLKSRLIMQVHDELIIEAPESEAARAAEILGEEMENAVSLSVRLRAEVKTGKTWYEAK